MKLLVALGMFLFLIGRLAAEDPAEVEENKVETSLHNLVKRSNPARYGYKATGNVKIGAPVVAKAPVFKEVATFVQDGFKYIYPKKGGSLRGGNFNRGSGYPYGYYPNVYQTGGYPYCYGAGFPYSYQSGYPYRYTTGYHFSGKGIHPYPSSFNTPVKGFGGNKLGY